MIDPDKNVGPDEVEEICRAMYEAGVSPHSKRAIQLIDPGSLSRAKLAALVRRLQTILYVK